MSVPLMELLNLLSVNMIYLQNIKD